MKKVYHFIFFFFLLSVAKAQIHTGKIDPAGNNCGNLLPAQFPDPVLIPCNSCQLEYPKLVNGIKYQRTHGNPTVSSGYYDMLDKEMGTVSIKAERAASGLISNEGVSFEYKFNKNRRYVVKVYGSTLTAFSDPGSTSSRFHGNVNAMISNDVVRSGCGYQLLSLQSLTPSIKRDLGIFEGGYDDGTDNLKYVSFEFTTTECYKYISLTLMPNPEWSQVTTNVYRLRSALRVNWIEINEYPVSRLNGSDAICGGSGVYQMSDMASDETVTWSVYPTGIVSLSPSGNSVTLNQLPGKSGRVQLTATVNGTVCSSTFIQQMKIDVGYPPASSLTIYGNTICAKTYTDFGAYVNGSCGYEMEEFEWYSPQMENIIYNQGMGAGCNPVNKSGVRIKMREDWNHNWYEVKVRARNKCGWSDWSPWFTFNGTNMCNGGGGGWTFAVSPNPASSDITVSVTEDKSGSENIAGSQKIQAEKDYYNITITDLMGNIKYTQKVSSSSHIFKIPRTRLGKGNYYLNIRYKEISKSQQIIIQ